MDRKRGNDVGFAVPMLPVNYAAAMNQKPSMMASTSSAGASTSSAGSSQQQQSAAAVIRRRRFSTAKIQPTRIKKVMQSDEEIGRMVQSVPVSIGRAMEHFAEKFLQASAETTQFTSSKTLNPQHMKQAILNTPHFAFLEPLFKDVSLPQQVADLNTARAEMTLREQQMFQEQQNSDLASVILANAQMQMLQEQMKHEEGASSPFGIEMQSPTAPLPMYLQGIPANYPVVQELAATIPLSPSTPTSQLVNGMMGMLKCNKKATDSESQRLTGIKRGSTDGTGDEDRPKRGRPKKLKADKCIDDDLYEEASRNIAKEDKDRELMPPPALPIGRP
uniref:CBFD_NFYB_HMF domain-containing protein n=2 Tax=Caenorhabditis tropicalis TaxID=1561998 RepID=A0A1I7UN55_9PELO